MSNNDIVDAHLPCPCGESHDAFSRRSDGSGYCFSCSRNFPSEDGPQIEVDSLQTYPMRSHSRAAEEFFRVKTVVSSRGEPLKRVYPYGDWSKVRNIPEKTFYTQGKSLPGLFGADRFSQGQSRSITIVEGEEDVLSVFEMLGRKYPVVSVRGSSTAKTDCAAQHAYLNSFDRVYLCLDNDEPGRRAAQAVAGLFDFNKIYDVRLTRFKDANEYEEAGAQEEFRSVWYNAQRFLPEGIISSWKTFAEIIRQKQTPAIGTWPVSCLQDMSYGIRSGEVILITAMEGIGKTEVIRSIEHHLLKTTDLNVACIHLEESQNRQLRGLAGYELALPCHLPDSGIPPEEIDNALHKLTTRDDRLHLYGHFGSDDPDIILDKVRFLVAAAGCKFVFLDHISMVVSGLNLDDERKVLDYLSTRFATMVHDLDFSFIMVSHVNDEEKTRGSRNISKVSDFHLHLDRDLTALSAAERNVTRLIVKKNRFGAQTGYAGSLYFDPGTFMLSEAQPELLPPE